MRLELYVIMNNQKRIFITGASSGIGKEIKIAANNKNIFCKTHSRKNQENEICGDINKNETQEKIIKFIQKNKINVFINNAGVYCYKPISEISDNEIKNIINTNLISCIQISKKILEIYKKQGYGMLYNINSLAGLYGCQNESIYCASKFGLKGFTDSLIQEFKQYKNIRIVNVVLGASKTKMTINRSNYEDLINPSEVANVILNHIETSYNSLKTDLTITRL